ncbi:MAG: hypothetical protein KDD64_05410 [Bdellovibrionales bacterium]|nr:hypothetical protein [Bdellovibrionales bacterium]
MKIGYFEEAECFSDDEMIGIASRIVRLRFAAPVLLLLELLKPFSRLSSQIFIVSMPLLLPLVGLTKLEKLQRLLSSPEAIEKLISRIEEGEYHFQKGEH